MTLSLYPGWCTLCPPNCRVFLCISPTSFTCCGKLPWWSSWVHQSSAHLSQYGSSVPCSSLRIMSKWKTTRGIYNLKIVKKKILHKHQCFNFYWSQSTQKIPYKRSQHSCEWFCSLPPYLSSLPHWQFHQVCDLWRERLHFLGYLVWPCGWWAMSQSSCASSGSFP